MTQRKNVYFEQILQSIFCCNLHIFNLLTQIIMDILYAIILGIVEGITEFLPISSTGHLIIVGDFINFPEPFATTFDVVIQSGAILAVVAYFFKRLFPIQTSTEHTKREEYFDLWKKILVALVPAILIGGVLGSKIQSLLFNSLVVAIMLIVGGIVLIWLEKSIKTFKFESIEQISYKIAFYIGLIQSLSMIPGTSRSAATIIGAMLLGASRKVAAEFSFFLAIPTMFAASVYTLYKNPINIHSTELLTIVVGFLTSFIVAFFVIKVFMKYISANSFIPFGYYRIFLGIVVILLVYLI